MNDLIRKAIDAEKQAHAKDAKLSEVLKDRLPNETLKFLKEMETQFINSKEYKQYLEDQKPLTTWKKFTKKIKQAWQVFFPTKETFEQRNRRLIQKAPIPEISPTKQYVEKQMGSVQDNMKNLKFEVELEDLPINKVSAETKHKIVELVQNDLQNKGNK